MLQEFYFLKLFELPYTLEKNSKFSLLPYFIAYLISIFNLKINLFNWKIFQNIQNVSSILNAGNIRNKISKLIQYFV